MPIKQQAKKALRQAKKRAERNKIVRMAYKDAVKVAKAAKGTEQNLAELLRTAQQKLDKAAKRGVIKKKTASRKLSRLVKYMAAEVKKV